MAKQTTVRLVDDIDGSEAAHEDFEFSIGGKSYVIDLSETHFQELQGAVDKFVQAARRTGQPVAPQRRQRGSGAARSVSDRQETQAIREWAKAHGHAVSDRGRIPRTVLEAYRAAS